jgi:hypothetical protein
VEHAALRDPLARRLFAIVFVRVERAIYRVRGTAAVVRCPIVERLPVEAVPRVACLAIVASENLVPSPSPIRIGEGSQKRAFASSSVR